jgi:group II intron reverse transcriptase/maturase
VGASLQKDFFQDVQAWRGLNKQAASGVDAVTCAAYRENLAENIQDLVARLKAKRYRPQRVRRTWIPKGKDQQRPLGIPALEDKLVQAAVAKILQAIWEPRFSQASFAYRPKLGAKNAVKFLSANLQYGSYSHVVEVDIKSFFDTIDHGWLEKMLGLQIRDRAFVGLIGKWLRAGVLETDGTVVHPGAGTPQGGVVSPVLANIYLHYALDLWFEKVVRPRCKGMALLCRYADDWVCAFQYREEAEAFYAALPGRLEKFQLQVAPEKTRMQRFSRFHPGRQTRFQFLGFEYYWELDRKGTPRVAKRTASKKLQRSIGEMKEWIRSNRSLPNREFFAQLNRKLRGYYNYFGIPGNSRALWRFHQEVVGLLYKWLNRRSQRKSYTWERLQRLLDFRGLAKPRILPLPKETIFVYPRGWCGGEQP